MLTNFLQKGKVSAIIGGQFGSEAKGSAAAFAAKILCERGEGFDLVAVNNGSQSGHTSVHNGVKRVAFHLPTYPIIAKQMSIKPCSTYLTAGAVIDVDILMKELSSGVIDLASFFIHPNAAVITDECKEAEQHPNSAQTKIASTRKGVGEAIARKALRSGLIARDCQELKPYVRRVNLNGALARGSSILMEVPQGFSLGLNGKFYPHATSRQCTVQQAMADADVHMSFGGPTMMVIRTFPIRVGNIYDASQDKDIGNSGGGYHDQRECTWEELGVEAEITTVTKRVRRVFTFSRAQLIDAMMVIRPEVVMITFCNYFKDQADVYKMVGWVEEASKTVGIALPEILLESGPSTADILPAVPF